MYMLFHNLQRKAHNLSIELKINSISIERVSEFILGPHTWWMLNWKTHVQKIPNKISRIISVLCRLKNYFPKHILRTLYNSLILPYPQYSVLTRGFKMGRVELLQKHAVCVISCSKYNAHTDLSFKQLNLLKLKDIFYYTHWGRVTHICVSKLTIIGSDNGLSPPSHYRNQCWNIVSSNLRNGLQWNPRRNSFIFILENAFENVVCDMASVWSRPQWGKRPEVILLT